MKRFSSPMLAAVTLGFVAGVQAAANADQTVREVRFAKGSSATVLEGEVRARHYIDYRLRAGAGQTMKVSMQVSNLANYFNVLPPGSENAAMFIAGAGDKVFDGLLPDDGVYTVRVYLVRAAARRNESSRLPAIAIDSV